jgi:hypothetical protein
MRLTTVILTFFMCGMLSAQVAFDAKVSKTQLGINERLRVGFTMNKDGDDFEPPNFENFTVVGGPSQSISNSWVNGVRSFSKSYSFFLAPKKRGKFTIGQATIKIEGETYKTLPINITVTAAIDKPKDPNDPDYIASNNIHLVAEISNANPYLNEAITVVYKLYVAQNTGVRNWREIDSPRFSDFWSQNIDVQGFDAKQGTYKGEDYLYVVLRKTVLYPQKTGKLKIEPLSLDVTVEVPSQRRDVFGRAFTSTVNRTVSSGNRTINVKALPEAGKPENFSGAVGNFGFKVTTNKLFQLPKLILPSALEVYEPEHSENVQVRGSGMQGSISDTYTVVPNYQGSYPIPKVSFSFFDIKSKRYKTLTSDRVVIEVNEGPVSATTSTNGAPTSVSKNIIQPSLNSFSAFKTTTVLEPIDAASFFNSTLFWWLLLAPFLAIPLVVFIVRNRTIRALDVSGNKIRKTNRLARKYLKHAKKSLGQKEQFYDALERALHNYLKSKLRLETSEFNKEKIEELLSQKNVTRATRDGFIALLTACELARYTPLSVVEMQNDYDKAASVINALDKQLNS